MRLINRPFFSLMRTRDRSEDFQFFRDNPGFDETWYVAKNPACKKHRGGPLAHFCTVGWREGRDPNPWFSVAYYLKNYPDVANAAINPFFHYCSIGWKEGRRPTSWFSPADYLDANIDVKLAGVEPLWHYLTHGRVEGRILRPKVRPKMQPEVRPEVRPKDFALPEVDYRYWAANYRYLLIAEDLLVAAILRIEKEIGGRGHLGQNEFDAYLGLISTINKSVQIWLSQHLSDQ